MLKLRNIKKNKNTISAQYEPENSGYIGSVEIEIDSGKLLNSQGTEYDEPLPIYLNHAVNALKSLISKKDIPQEKIIMWY